MAIEIPNVFPTIESVEYKIAIVGEKPTHDDLVTRQPFTGYAGNLLGQLMSRAGIMKLGCFLGHYCQQEGYYSPDHWAMQAGRKQLHKDLQKFQPNLVFLLGEKNLRRAGISHSLENYRGSVFKSLNTDEPFYGFKCMASFEPADVLRIYENMPLLLHDLTRARRVGTTPDLELPQRAYLLNPTIEEIEDRIYNWPLDHPGAFDIEGGIQQTITCMSIAWSQSEAMIIDWKNMPSAWQVRAYKAVHWWLTNPRIPKVAQNVLYESVCLGYKHRVPIANMYWDTMLSGWEIFPELKKALEVQTSIWTDEPYYKYQRKIHDDSTHNKYCCTDSLVTFEIFTKHKEYLEERPNAYKHFEFNMQLMPALSYIQLRGIKYDKETAQEELLALNVEIEQTQFYIDQLAGAPLNTNSPKQMVDCLYKRMGYTKQYKREGGRKTDKLTCDTIALLNLLKIHNADIIYFILKLRQLFEVRKQLSFTTDPDGRMRATYNPVGTDTGRFSCSTSNTGSGYNLQTTQKRLRHLFRADDGMVMAQLDLAGADGWTVAAHSKRLNDSSMMDDYLCGVKPARVIAAMYLSQDKSIARLDSATLKEIISKVEIPAWLYNACKAIQHGTSYGMGAPTTSNNILKRSWKDSGEPVYVSVKDCKILQEYFEARYTGVGKWQSWVKLMLTTKGYLPSAAGHTRYFMGRKTDASVFQTALSQEPQINTTFATSLGMHRLWHDPENRNGRKLIIEPMHQVHDALIVQWPEEKTDWAVAKMRDYFDNPLQIAEQTITIPYEGEYGRYWGDNSLGTI